MAMLDPRQMRRQGLAAGPDPGFAGGFRRLPGELFQFRLNGGLVGQRRFVKEVVLAGGRQGFAFLAEAQALVVGQFEGEGLDLEFGGGEGGGLAGNRLAGFCPFGG